jgi:tetratricopeptide (TPR) repeat protein
VIKQTPPVLALVLALVFCGCASLKDGGAVRASADNPNECDNQAAHPEDIMRLAQGKTDEQVVGVLAQRACSEALGQFPSEPRFHFQMGRALLALKREGDAVKEFDTAASMGYAPAKHYRAEALLDSYLNGSGPDSEYEEAVRLLEEVKESFAPAGRRYDEVVLNLEGFQNPRIIEAMYRGDVERLNRVRILVAFYAQGMQKFLSIDYHPTDIQCPAILVDSSINLDLDAAVVGDPRNTLERFGYNAMFVGAEWAGKIFIDPTYQGDPEKWREYYQSLGHRDGFYLANKFGCQSPVSRKVYSGLVKFAKAKRPLSEYAEELTKSRGKDLFLIAAEESGEDDGVTTATSH